MIYVLTIVHTNGMSSEAIYKDYDKAVEQFEGFCKSAERGKNSGRETRIVFIKLGYFNVECLDDTDYVHVSTCFNNTNTVLLRSFI